LEHQVSPRLVLLVVEVVLALVKQTGKTILWMELTTITRQLLVRLVRVKAQLQVVKVQVLATMALAMFLATTKCQQHLELVV
jgi:hypothetical protein